MPLSHTFGRILAVSLACAVLVAPAAAGDEPGGNVLRNGSFEGSMKYWLREGGANVVDREVRAFGAASARVETGRLMSTPFPLSGGSTVRVAFSVRSENDGEISFNVRPSKRDVSQQPGRRHGRKEALRGGQWQRVVFEFTTPEIQTSSREDDFDAKTSWMFDVSGPKPFWLDGVVVSERPSEPKSASPAFVGRRPIEVAIDAPELTRARYLRDGNLLRPGDTVPLAVAVSNPGPRPREVQLIVAFVDYDGRPLPGRALVDKRLTIASSSFVSEEFRAAMPSVPGHYLVRALVRDARNPREVLDQSDQPLTSLPFPKAASAPDVRERVGASFRGPLTLELGRQIGFRWARWGPVGWSSVQKEGPDAWNWERSDEWVKRLADAGMAYLYITYNLPAWAKPPKDSPDLHCPVLPVDMQWPVDDPRWRDLSVETSWDKFLAAVVRRYPGDAIVFQLANEPDLRDRSFTKHVEHYRLLAHRSYEVAKRARPDALFSVNNTYPWPTPLTKRWAEDDGIKRADILTWHNYHDRSIGAAHTVKRFTDFFADYGNPKLRLWFDEGGVFLNSSQDNAAPAVGATTPARWAHLTVRSMADMFSAGLEKHILFYTGYETNGRSWWDWLTNGGTELWDENDQPMVGTVVWNVLIDSLGLSENVEALKVGEVSVRVFQDLRNRRGVAVVWGPQDQAATLRLPSGASFVRRDVMGRDQVVAGATLELPADGCPYYVFTTDSRSGPELAALFKRL